MRKAKAGVQKSSYEACQACLTAAQESFYVAPSRHGIFVEFYEITVELRRNSGEFYKVFGELYVSFIEFYKVFIELYKVSRELYRSFIEVKNLENIKKTLFF